MNIMMFTNVFTPQVGGITRSVRLHADALRARGHRVLIVAPTYAGTADDEEDLVRIPSLHRAYKGTYSVPITMPGSLTLKHLRFDTDIVHAHHPFLLGSAGAVHASFRRVPLVYTHHTQFEQYAENSAYAPETFRRFIHGVTNRFLDLADTVIAPSRGMAALLASETQTPIELLPTGVDTDHFAPGHLDDAKRALGLPADTFVVGHVGRLSPEKNLGILGDAVGRFAREHARARFVVVGEGRATCELIAAFTRHASADRLHLLGVLHGEALRQAYQAFDVFAFASVAETQGLVVSEALATGVPVVALRAIGVEDVVAHGVNGFLLDEPDPSAFASFLARIEGMTRAARQKLGQEARQSMESESNSASVDRLVSLYRRLILQRARQRRRNESTWPSLAGSMETQMALVGNVVAALGESIWPAPLTRRDVKETIRSS